MPRSSPSSSEGPGFAGAGELRTCVFSTNAIPGCPVQTRTGLNAATDMTGFRFALAALDEISWFFSTDTFMRVSDVADAFFNVPLHPNVWPFFRRFFSAPDSVVEHFYLHTPADFGAAEMPGIFRLLLRALCRSDGARRPGAHTLPMAVYVDGNCLMGPCRGRVDAEMHSFQAWALDVVA